jgi:hypothetical protein
VNVFRLAPMSTGIRALTIGLLAFPLVFTALAVLGQPIPIPALRVFPRLFAIPAIFFALMYAWIWLQFRPTRFIVHPDALEIVWPIRRRRLLRSEISQARVIDAEQMRREIGWGMRIGAGGFCGAFGWLWTRHRGIVRMYISRRDRLVWIERGAKRPWLITPERPEAFVEALALAQAAARRH